jgi:hypothetical protein
MPVAFFCYYRNFNVLMFRCTGKLVNFGGKGLNWSDIWAFKYHYLVSGQIPVPDVKTAIFPIRNSVHF